MTQREKEIAVVKFKGWKTFDNSQHYPSGKVWTRPDGTKAHWNDIPEYGSDLNACAEFQELAKEHIDKYVHLLRLLTYYDSEPAVSFAHFIVGDNYWDGHVFASAAHRLEAFGLLYGLWDNWNLKFSRSEYARA